MSAHLGTVAATLALSAVTLVGGCQSAGRLAEYDFAGSTLTTVYDLPPYPEVLTGPYFPGHPRDPIHALMRVGTTVAKEVAASGLRERLDSASLNVDVAARLSERLGTRSARLLRAELVPDQTSADFILEVQVRDYGIDATDWQAATHLFVDAQVLLLDGTDGSEIWESHVRERDPVMPQIFGGGRAHIARDIVTAAVLADMSEQEIGRALEAIADYAADRISERLRGSLEEARDDRRERVVVPLG